MIANQKTATFNHTPRIDNLMLIRRYHHYQKLVSSGFPSWDARNMSDLANKDQFELAKIFFENRID